MIIADIVVVLKKNVMIKDLDSTVASKVAEEIKKVGAGELFGLKINEFLESSILKSWE